MSFQRVRYNLSFYRGEDVNGALSPEAAKRYHLMMSPIVKMAKEVDIEMTQAFIFGSAPTVDQPLDFLCRSIDTVNDKKKFKELITKCFDAGIQLSTPLEAMNLDQLAALYDVALEAGDFTIEPKVAGLLEKQLNNTLKSSSRKVRSVFKEFEVFTTSSSGSKDLLLQYNVLKALNNERGFEALNKSPLFTKNGLKSRLDTWKAKEKDRNVLLAQGAERAEQQRLDAESTSANIEKVLKFHEQEAAAATAAKEEADTAKALLLATPAKKFLEMPRNPNAFSNNSNSNLVKLARTGVDPDASLSQMDVEQLFALHNVLEDFASDPNHEKDISILSPEVESELNKKLDNEFQKNPNRKIKKLFSQHKEALSDNFSLKKSLLYELQLRGDTSIVEFNSADSKIPK